MPNYMYIPKNLDINLFFHILKLFSKTIFLTTKWHIRIITIEQIVKHSKFEMKTHGLLKMKEIQGPKRRFDQPFSNCFPWYLLKRSVEILRICCWNSTTLIIWFWRLIPLEQLQSFVVSLGCWVQHIQGTNGTINQHRPKEQNTFKQLMVLAS